MKLGKGSSIWLTKSLMTIWNVCMYYLKPLGYSLCISTDTWLQSSISCLTEVVLSHCLHIHLHLLFHLCGRDASRQPACLLSRTVTSCLWSMDTAVGFPCVLGRTHTTNIWSNWSSRLLQLYENDLCVMESCHVD